MRPFIRAIFLGAALSSSPALGGCGDAPAPAAAPVPGPVAALEAPLAPLSAAELAAIPGRILYLAEGEGEAAIVELGFGPGGQEPRDMLRAPSIAGPPSIYPGPISPNGAFLVVVTVDEGPSGHMERLELRPLVHGADPSQPALGPARWRSDAAAQVRSPAWSPDGRFLVFESSIASFRDLYRLDLTDPGGDAPPTLRRLTDHPAGNYEPAVSPDGGAIAFVSSRDGNAEIYVMQADGAAPRRITREPLDDSGPIWAPDGRTIAFLSNRGGVDRIYLVGADGSDLRPLITRSPGASAKGDAHPSSAVHDAAHDASHASAGALGYEASEAEPSFSPDGAAVLFSVRTGPQRSSIRIAPVAPIAPGDGTPVRSLTPGTASDRSPIWSPDGAFVVFSSDRDGDLELYVARRDGGALTRLTARPGADWLARWAPR